MVEDIEMANTQPQQPTMQQLVATIQALEGRIEQLQAGQTEPRARKVKIRNPDTFDGNRQKLQGFVSQLERYIRIYDDQFEDEEDKVLFASTYLRGTAERWFEPYLNEHLHKEEEERSQTTRDMFDDYDEFVKHLKRAFNDVDEVRQATQKIMSIQQRTSVADYTSTFRQAASFLEGWSDQAQRDHYYKGLKTNIKDAMAFHPYPDTLDGMIELARRLDDRFWERRSERYPANTTRPARPRHTQEGGDAMELDNANRNENRKNWNNNNKGKNTRRFNGPNPNWTDEQKRRFKEKLCIHCGKDWKPGHNCPQNPKNKNRKDAATMGRSHAAAAREEFQKIDQRREEHAKLSWTACFDDDCTTHQSDKDATGWYPKGPRRQAAPMHRNEEVLDIDDFVDAFPDDEELVDSDTGDLYDSTPEPDSGAASATSEVAKDAPENQEQRLAAKVEPRGKDPVSTQEDRLLDAMLQQASNNGLTWKLPPAGNQPAKGLWIPGVELRQDYYMVEWEIREGKPYERRSYPDDTRTPWIPVPEGEYPDQGQQQSKN